MTARHRRDPSPPVTRLRRLVLLLVVVFVVALIVMASRDEEGVPAVPEADGAPEPGDQPDTTDPSETTQPDEAPTTEADLSSLQALGLEVVDSGYQHPTAIRAVPGDDRLFIVQRVGVIRIIDSDREMLDPAFLAIDDRVLAGGIEQGLLGLAFHPEFEVNGRFFVYYTNRQGQRQLSEFAVDPADPNRADHESERALFQLDQPPNSTDIRHYGGDIHFGPDGFLWVSSGDGADARGQGQDPHTMFAALLGIDVDSGDPYGIPPDNPFADGAEGAAEVWAYGLRNPWRFFIDPVDAIPVSPGPNSSSLPSSILTCILPEITYIV